MSDKKEAIVMEAQQGTVRPHQPGQDVFRSVLPEDIDWKPFAAFPPSVRLAGFRDWFVLNSMSAPEESAVFGHVGGMHLIHVNAKGLAVLKAGGQSPYPDGTIFADDVHEFSVKDGATVEGAKKFVTVMVNDAKKYASTGGWGFQVWAGGDPSKPQIPRRSPRNPSLLPVPHAAKDARLCVFHVHSLRVRTGDIRGGCKMKPRVF